MLDALPLSEDFPDDLQTLTAEEYRAGYPLRIRPVALPDTGRAELRFYRDNQAWAVGIHYVTITKQPPTSRAIIHGILKISPASWDVLPFEGLMDRDGWVSEASGQMRKAYIINDARDYAALATPLPADDVYDLADLMTG